MFLGKKAFKANFCHVRFILKDASIPKMHLRGAGVLQKELWVKMHRCILYRSFFVTKQFKGRHAHTE